MRDYTIWGDVQGGGFVELGDGMGAIPERGDEIRVDFGDIGPGLLVVYRRIFDGATSQWHVYTRRTAAPIPDHPWDGHRPAGSVIRDLPVNLPDPARPVHQAQGLAERGR